MIITIIVIFAALFWLLVETKWLTVRLPVYAVEPVVEFPSVRKIIRAVKLPDVRATFKMPNIYGILALAGIIGPVLLVTLDLIGGLTTPNYSPLRQTMSALALTPGGGMETIGFMLMGLMIESFTAALYLGIKRRRGFGVGTALLTFFGFGMLMIGTFKTKEVGAPSTFSSIIHTIASDSVLGLFPIALALILPSIKKDPRWCNLFVYTIIAGAIAISMAICYPFLPKDFRFWGLFERIMVLNALVWLVTFAGRLLVLSFRPVK
ncbi:MAG: DUF998 domain-containing protein [Dehalococcoidales bacterium]|nr:DUF998 domain-containing protein [Dehalococcoidales bacterium]